MKTLKSVSLAVIIFCVSFMAGCMPIVEDLILCDCSDVQLGDIESKKLPSFKINGKFELKFRSGDDKINESYSVKMFYNGPSELYFQADHLVLNRAIILGGSENEYWAWIRHNEISSYWYGNWDSGCSLSANALIISPAIILKAMGLVDCGYPLQWTKQGSYAVATEIVESWTKKYYYNCCEPKNLAKIEYYKDGEMVYDCLLSDYFQVQGSKLPGNIRLTLHGNDETKGFVKIYFKPASFAVKDYSDKFRDKYFTRPEPGKTRNVYEILDNGQTVKISQ